MLQKQIEIDFIAAFKAKQTQKKNTLGIVKTRITEWKVDKKNTGKEILDEDIISIISSEIKKRNQTLELYKDATDPAVIANANVEKQEIDILREYLPSQLSDEELKQIISSLRDEVNLKPEASKSFIGLVMAHLNKNFKGKFDARIVQELLK